MPKFFNNRRTIDPPEVKKCKSSDPRCHRGTAVHRKWPESPHLFWARIKNPAFHLGCELARGVQANVVQVCAGVFHPRHVHWGFVGTLPRGCDFSRLGAADGSIRRDARYPGRRVPLSYFSRSYGCRRSATAFGCGLTVPLCSFGVAI